MKIVTYKNLTTLYNNKINNLQNTIEIVEQLNKEWTEKKTNVAPTGILGFNSAASQIQTSYLVVLFVFKSFYF